MSDNTSPPVRGASRSDIHIVNEYPHPQHTGFRGIGGFMMSKVLSRVRKKMLGVGLPALLSKLDDQR
jgi:hypothetical protein